MYIAGAINLTLGCIKLIIQFAVISYIGWNLIYDLLPVCLLILCGILSIRAGMNKAVPDATANLWMLIILVAYYVIYTIVTSILASIEENK